MKITACLILFLFAGMVSAGDGAGPPNIVFVFADDHATQAISAYGGSLAEVAPTPHIDRIAENGMRFNQCMVANSISGPSSANAP